MMVESTPEFSHPISAMLQLWKEGSWMRGWLFSAFIHLSSGDSMYRLPWNAVRLRLMTDPQRWVAYGGNAFACKSQRLRMGALLPQSIVGGMECVRLAYPLVWVASVSLVGLAYVSFLVAQCAAQ